MKNRLPFRKTLRRACSGALVCGAPGVLALWSAGSAAAQPVAEAKKVNGLGGVMLALLMLIGVVVVSFISPRRGPQD